MTGSSTTKGGITGRTIPGPAVTGTGIRAALAADPGLGAGNVLHKLIEHGAPLDGPGVTFDTAVDAHPAGHALTLGELREAVAARAVWLSRQGIGPRDPVALYVTSAADCFLHFMALTWLGAIPALMNPNLPGDVAAEYIRRLRAVGLLTDADHRRLLARADRGLELGFATEAVYDVAVTGAGDPAAAPRPYRHADDDPIAITHSSGTTRMPTAVTQTHGNLFVGTRLLRLRKPRARGTERILSALPAPHAAGIMAVNHALCNRSDLLYLSRPDDGPAVVDAIERWRPTGVFGFAVTWAELARIDLSERAVDSVSLWYNTGDCAHEPHIRHLVAAGSYEKVTREGVHRVPGSMFVDGLGSSEMGHNAFHITHTPDTERYGRCVGRTHDFAEIKLLDPATGEEVPVGEVGLCGMKSPSLSPGYWNDSANTYRNRRNGYYLTGDLLYRDEEGYYYHVDRMVDAVDLGGGRWLYTAMSEERILKTCPDVLDCTVVAVPTEGGVVTDVLLTLHPWADPHDDWEPAVRGALTDAAAATLRSVLVIGDDRLVVGPTGKVRKFLMRQRYVTDSVAQDAPDPASDPDPASGTISGTASDAQESRPL
ncbi:class I adenylate-forming enzyme family protein [Catenulispora pinistramenti]|uniref:class I adenylate-forming enzyme family protein n=1 Tax=Catenulispora pinistramenti TaxID=2705254 RepID=UPI001E3A5641|nr:class I adenylate-forming enzyme family protein [Catenulispora pinistramenti]